MPSGRGQPASGPRRGWATKQGPDHKKALSLSFVSSSWRQAEADGTLSAFRSFRVTAWGGGARKLATRRSHPSPPPPPPSLTHPCSALPWAFSPGAHAGRGVRACARAGEHVHVCVHVSAGHWVLIYCCPMPSLPPCEAFHSVLQLGRLPAVFSVTEVFCN